MNSYMLPQGARCTATPRETTATRCASMPTVLSVTAPRTQGPAAQIERNAPSRGDGTPCAVPPAAAPSADPPPVTACPAGTSAALAEPAAVGAAVARRGRPKA